MKRILVTGGAGYVGSRLVPILLEKNYKVRVLDNITYQQTVLLEHFINPNFEFMRGDVSDPYAVWEALKGVDFIIHLASIVGAPACDKAPEQARKTNVDGTRNINTLRQKIPMIFLSSGSVYGKIDDLCTEESKTNPLSLYSETKLEGEKIVKETGNCIIFRPATAFGVSPRMRLDLLVNDFVYCAIKHKSLTIFEGNARRSFIHVTDFAKALVFATEHFDEMKDNTYNMGSESMNHTKIDVAKEIKKKVNFILESSETGTDPDKRDYEVSYKKLRDIGFSTKVSLKQGINELIEGYKIVVPQKAFTNNW